MSTKGKNALPPGLVANLQQVLGSRNNAGGGGEEHSETKDEVSSPATDVVNPEEQVSDKPVILVTNGDGIESPGLVSLVEVLARDGRFGVHVCAPQFDKSASGHSMTVRETVEVSSAVISGAASCYEVSGTPADCVSLALSQALFSWTKPVLVISGINRGSNCGQNILCSGAVAGAREALVHGLPAICISLNWKKEESPESAFKDAADASFPLIQAVLRDLEKGEFPKSCLLNIEIPISPSINKGFKLTRQSLWRSGLSWRAVSSYRHPAAGQFMSSQQSLGLSLAQLGRDASAAGAARRSTANKKNVEIESVGAAGKSNSQPVVRKHYRLEFDDKKCEDEDEDLDFKALENEFIAVTPLALSADAQSKIQSSVSDWLTAALPNES